MRPRSRSGTSSAASVAVRQLRDVFGFTQQQFAVYLGISMGTIARYETDRTPGGPTLKRFIDLASDRQRQDLADIFQKELRGQVLDWMGVGAAARQIYRKTLRPEVLMEARKKIAVLSQHSEVFEDRLVSRTKALEAGRRIRRELIELSSLIIPEGEAKAMPQPAGEEPNG